MPQDIEDTDPRSPLRVEATFGQRSRL